MKQLELKRAENQVSRATLLDLEIEIEKLKKEISELKVQRISSRDQRFRLKQAEIDLAKFSSEVEKKEATQKLSPRERAIKARQEDEAEKAKQLRLSREPFRPNLEILSWREKERRKLENSRKKKLRRSK